MKHGEGRRRAEDPHPPARVQAHRPTEAEVLLGERRRRVLQRDGPITATGMSARPKH